MSILHNFQSKAVADVFNAFKRHKSVMLQMPTGTGKTHVFCEIIKKVDKKTLVLVHTRELVLQIQQRLQLFGIPSGIILAGIKPQPALMVQIASIQTLSRKELAMWPKNVSLIVIDEAHHATANTYQQILKHYQQPTLKVLGVTATPYHMNNTGFKNTFDTLIDTLSVKEFIAQGYLAGFKHLATACPELSYVKVDKITNDYDINELADVMSQETVMSNLIDSYIKHGKNQKCIVFAVNRYHSKMIVERFKAVGIKADYIDSKTKMPERQTILNQFKGGEIQVLCNVQIFTEGFDCPGISVVQLARPTKSLVLYMQMVGRALRKKVDGSQALILDNAGLWKKHGLVTKQRKWRLDGVAVTTDTVAVKNISNEEVLESEPKNIFEVDGLEMQEIASFNIPNTASTPSTPILLNAQLLQQQRVFKNLEVTIEHSLSFAELATYLKTLTPSQQPDEMIVTFSGIAIPNQWQEKQTWLAENEKLIEQSLPANYITIGWEESATKLALRFLNSNADVMNNAGSIWKQHTAI